MAAPQEHSDGLQRMARSAHVSSDKATEDTVAKRRVVSAPIPTVKKEPRRGEDEFLRGWIFRRSGLKKTSMFAILRVGKIEFRERAFDDEVLEEIDVRSCELSFCEAKKSITVQPISGKPCTFFTDSVQDLDKWVKALQVVSAWDVKSDYELRQQLGKGKYGTVWHAVDKRSGKEVALKAVSKSRSQAKHLDRERVISNLVEDSHVIRCYDIFESSDRTYFVQELARGGTLDAYLHRRPYHRVDEKEAKIIMYHILSGLKYLHDNDIAHRDLKPENIVMSIGNNGKMYPKLCDFGLSKLTDTLKPMRSTVGSPNFVAPEVILGKPYDVSIDIWSCGILIYVLVVGKCPFQASSFHELKKILKTFGSDSITNWGPMSTRCRALVTKFLQRDPKQRPTVQQALMDPWLQNVCG
mmetsp:Transcript_11454/g.35001  ORF Transcript_11454/g.35001 Transcript_11454/m.35001 type:complete len:411 (+) Transcript_11454:120-1352(+)